MTAAFLAGCSVVVSDPLSPQVSPEVQARIAALPQKYRQLAAGSLPAALDGVSLAGAEISDLIRSTGAQPGDWATCVKTNTSGKVEYFAVFYGDGSYLSARTAVGTDNCPIKVYTLLPPKSPTKKS